MIEDLLVFIPARGGSKGVPNKNIALLGGKPLIAYTIDVVHSIPGANNILFSSNDDEIIGCARQCGLEVSYKRPEEFSQDTSGMLETVLNGLDWWQKTYAALPAHVLLLHPTSPFRTVSHVDAAIKQYFSQGLESLASVQYIVEHPYETVVTDEKSWHFLVEPPEPVVRRQDYPLNYYHMNGAIHIVSVDFLRKNQSFYGDETQIFVMDRLHSLDINDEIDFCWAEFLLKNNMLDL